MTTDIGTISAASLTKVGDSDLLRYAAEPQSMWRNALGSAASTAGKLLGGLTNTAAGSVGIEPQYANLIQEQIHQQTQMQLVSLVSNVEKSKHETQMSAIRNVRAG